MYERFQVAKPNLIPASLWMCLCECSLAFLHSLPTLYQVSKTQASQVLLFVYYHMCAGSNECSQLLSHLSSPQNFSLNIWLFLPLIFLPRPYLYLFLYYLLSLLTSRKDLPSLGSRRLLHGQFSYKHGCELAEKSAFQHQPFMSFVYGFDTHHSSTEIQAVLDMAAHICNPMS